jgi:hypothetical protein
MRKILLAAVAVAMLTAGIAGVAVAKTFVCKTVPCVGTANGDQISERKGSVVDVIRAGAGGDRVDATRAGDDRDDVLGQGGNDLLGVIDGDFRDNANCGPGPDDAAFIDASFDSEAAEPNVDGSRGCETLFLGGPGEGGGTSAANATPASAEIVEASEAKGE